MVLLTPSGYTKYIGTNSQYYAQLPLTSVDIVLFEAKYMLRLQVLLFFPHFINLYKHSTFACKSHTNSS